MMTSLAPAARHFWDAYVAHELAAGRPAPLLYDTMTIGNDETSADVGADLIRSGQKTATSALPSDFAGAGKRPPLPGDLSLVINGRGRPVCIVRTIAVETRALGDVDDGFARDYGEWDRTLATWRDRILAHYRDCLWTDPLATPLVCERFVRVWPQLD